MRSLLFAAVLAALPSATLAQAAPWSLALDLGIARDLGGESATAVPVGLVATFWLVGDLDAYVRGTWRFAPRTDGRGTDGAFEAGAGLRYSLWSGPIRPQLLAGASFVDVLGSELAAPDFGVRLSTAAALEAFPTRDLTVSLVAELGELLLASGAATPAASLSLRVGAYF